MKLYLSLAACLLFATTCVAQSNIVVNIPGDNSCSIVSGEPGFNALTWAIGGASTLKVGGNSLNSPPPTLQDLVITRDMDGCSAGVIKSFLSATRITNMTLIQYQPQGQRMYAAVTIALTNAYIASYTVSGSTTVQAAETIDITYSKMCLTTVAMNSRGGLDSPQKVCYDVVGRILN